MKTKLTGKANSRAADRSGIDLSFFTVGGFLLLFMLYVYAAGLILSIENQLFLSLLGVDHPHQPVFQFEKLGHLTPRDHRLKGRTNQMVAFHLAIQGAREICSQKPLKPLRNKAFAINNLHGL